MNNLKKATLFVIVLSVLSSFIPAPSYQLALLKYNGGGDWYANLETSLPNLIKFCNDNLNTNINPEQAVVEVGSPEIFNYPFVHLTGHGNIVFNPQERDNLRNYLIGGGFLHISDNYGLDKFIRPQMKNVFPELHQQQDFVARVIQEEESNFLKTLGSGIKLFYEYLW